MGRFSKNRKLLALCVLSAVLIIAPSLARGQEIVDKTVATVSDGVRTELITYSDILWQLALQPGVPLDPPRKEDIDQALQSLTNQRLFALEAQRLPRNPPPQKEVEDEIGYILGRFPSPAAFETRLKQVGFASVKDDNFVKLVTQRLEIDKYVKFRFESFIVITAEEQKKYYRDVFVPDFRRMSPGLLVPAFEEKRQEIHGTLTRQKVAASIERFLDEAKQRVDIEILIDA